MPGDVFHVLQMKKRYKLREVLTMLGVHIPIKKSYSQLDVLKLKRHLSSREGACMLYDPIPAAGVRWIDKRAREHNMAFVRRKRGHAKFVKFDDAKDLPQNYWEIGEKLVTDLPENLFYQLNAHV